MEGKCQTWSFETYSIWLNKKYIYNIIVWIKKIWQLKIFIIKMLFLFENYNINFDNQIPRSPF